MEENISVKETLPRVSSWKKLRVSLFLFVGLLGVVVMVALSLAWAVPALKNSSWHKPSRSSMSASYQAVFLTNGQVYFGKAADDTRDPVVLHEVYYLQVTQQLQPAPSPGVSPQTVPQISLVKLGNELHGPTDEMRITRSQVLFIEDLKDDSAVTKAIREFTKAKK